MSKLLCSIRGSKRRPPRKTSARDEKPEGEDAQRAQQQTDFQDDAKDLERGTPLWKITSNKKVYQRIFRLDADHQTIHYNDIGSYRYAVCQSRPRIIDVGQIREVRCGYKTDVFHLCDDDKKFVAKFPEDRCFAFVMGRGKTVNLVAPSVDTRKKWVNVVEHVIGKQQNENREARLERFLKKQFILADTSGDGFLNLEECMKLLSHLNLQFTHEKAKGFFLSAGAKFHHSEDGASVLVLDADGFHQFYRLLSERPDLKKIFQEHTAEKSAGAVWSLSNLQTFLQNTQKEAERSVDACEYIIKTFEPLEENQARNELSLQGFRNYLLNQKQFLFNSHHRQVYHDMTHPLKDYFIASSHNTYLMANQLTGSSSVEAYVLCLLQGCRCVELDCWDGPEGEPIITHGRTLTSNIYFRDVVTVIKEYGFRTSPYPVILSIENHCSVEQQDVMANHLNNILKEMLYCESPKDSDKLLPSPDSLKGRVILKAKKIKPLGKTESLPSEGDDDLAKSAVDGTDIDAPPVTKKDKQLQLKISQILSNGTYLHAVKFRGYDHSKTSGKFFEMSSLSETKSLSLIQESRSGLISHTRRQLVRIYPDGLRTDSSNYDPIPMLHAGCQIVALNYQDRRAETQVYKAMFRDNGGCGYLLKPEYLRSEDMDPDEYNNRIIPIKLRITVISAQQLPKPDGIDGHDITDPYVTLQIYGCARDCKKEKTKYIRNNGFNPSWEETFTFTIHDQEMAVMRFEVKDFETSSVNEVIAHYTIPVTSMKEGYRHVELFDKQDAPLDPATLFVKVEKEPIVPQQLETI
ncbi:1-phosphatidylinositol 4,5-bisphosphate phosphodiesterase delta-1-like [Paramacrobiotus metropolitanus]|uniref:1-phosphatidylinositol 4,5-bisphosphate phosphodiesterase delta-1-like n=1 Tax=Paramacrobiotus metropolitanus TaxID=2943436 RepID=UPI0024463A47|nr:1-phosphatidylinositol 4,5-bisphosphate phosphodiesterase delta-1-like [Paramacrobiotus metropolitanus]